MVYQRVASVSELKRGGMLSVRLGNTKIVIVQTDDGELAALVDVCTHANVRLSKGTFRGCAGESGKGEIECPAHGVRFDIITGKNLCPPAVTPLRVFPIKIEGEDVLVDID